MKKRMRRGYRSREEDGARGARVRISSWRGGDLAPPIGRWRLSLADLLNDIGAVDSGGAQSNAFPSETRQERTAIFIDMRHVA
jgi:hypothetical protein